MPVSNSSLGVHLGNINICAPTCADDTALLANTTEELQAMLDIVDFNTERDLVKINPDKSEILTFNSSKQPTVSIDGQKVSEVQTLKHLGINRNKKNSVDREERFKTAQKTVYSLLGPGLHARKGNSPIVSYKIWRTYVTPRFLYGIEVQQISKTDQQKLENYQKKILKHIQGLPERTSTAAVYILIGGEPVEILLDRACLSLFLNILHLPDSIEYKLLERQLIMSNSDGTSFTAKVRRILDKYNLPAPEQIMDNIPTKSKWKSTFKVAVNRHWANIWANDLSTQATTKYLQMQQNPIGKPNNVWSSARSKPHEVMRAEIKCRLLTGTYILQTNMAKYNQNTVPPTCKLCELEDETRVHLVTRCPTLSTIRDEALSKLRHILQHTYRLEDMDCNLLTHMVMDCTHSKVKEKMTLSQSQEVDVERWSQTYCERLIAERTRVLGAM